LLKKQIIQGNKVVTVEQLTPLLRQKPNGKVLFFIPEISIYNYGLKSYKPEKIKTKIKNIEKKFDGKIAQATIDNKREKLKRLEYRRKEKVDKQTLVLNEGNWLMRAVGSKPVFYDSTLAKTTAYQMQLFLHNKGFFQAQVNTEKKILPKKRASVIYQISENQPTYFGDIEYITENQQIDSVLKAHANESLIKKGEGYDRDILTKERARVEQLLRNNGYLFFNQQYIFFRVDTISFSASPAKTPPKDSLTQEKTEDALPKKSRYAKINVIINEPIKGAHKAWNISNVYFHFVNQKRRTWQKDTLTSPESRIKYIYESKRVNYAYHVFNQRIKLKPGQLYKQQNLLNTQLLVGNMDLFKFVNIDPDTSFNQLDFNIYTKPLERFQLTDEIGLNVAQGLPGPYVNVGLKNRNTFGGAEIFDVGARFSIDGQTSFSQESQFYSALQANFQTSLTFPRLLFPRKLIYKKLRENLEYYTPSTRLSLAYNYVRRPEYTRTILSGAIAYQGQVRNSTYNFTLSELSVVNTERKSFAFDSLLTVLESQGNPIRQSFNRAIVSSIYFTYTFNNNTGNEAKKSHYIRLLLETGGNVLSLLNESPLKTGNKILGLTYFQYWRFNSTFHYYLPLNKKNSMLAMRANLGIARPYGNSNTLPYEKFFFAGGGSSIRAWRPRRLGPGSQAPVDTNKTTNEVFINYAFEKPGDIILEGNLEWRFPMLDFIRGAFFVDAGNVWTYEDVANNPGGKFRLNTFWRQIAIGTGFGVRFNLPFLLLRIDLGHKVYDPGRLTTDPWVIKKPFKSGLMELNFGIGYPF
jgi:outer membrane protein assembly factor BamA